MDRRLDARGCGDDAVGANRAAADLLHSCFSRCRPARPVHRQRRWDGRTSAPRPPDVDYDAAWSPDGAWIAFTSERNGSADIYRVHPDGSGLERLTDSPAYDDQAAFSPDGRQIVFVTTRADGTADLWTLDVRMRRAKALTSGPAATSVRRGRRTANGSPSRRIAAQDCRSRTAAGKRCTHRHLSDSPGRLRPETAHEHTATCGSPKWSADSRRVIAYCNDPARDDGFPAAGEPERRIDARRHDRRGQRRGRQMPRAALA